MALVGVAPEVANRIRRLPPPGHSILPGSLPVVAFGNPSRARVATLSLNPSDAEFFAGTVWLDGDLRRLESLHSLGLDNPSELTDEQVERVARKCDDYFTGNWLKSWFGPLERLMAKSGAGSYLDGSACHLDLVQWATRPKQSKVPRTRWHRLVDEDSGFLRWQLATCTIQTLLVNGKGVIDQLKTYGLVDSWEEEQIPFQGKTKPRTLRVFTGTVDGTPALGWNLPVAQGISADGRTKLSDWVRDHLPADD